MNVSRIVAQRELIRRSPCDSSRSVTKLPTVQPPVHQQPPEDHPEEAAPPVLLQTKEKHYAPISDSFRFRLGIPTPIHHRRTITTRSPRLTHLPPVPKALDQLRDIQAVRQQQTRPTPATPPTSWNSMSTKEFPGSPPIDGFVFSKHHVECFSAHLMRPTSHATSVLRSCSDRCTSGGI